MYILTAWILILYSIYNFTTLQTTFAQCVRLFFDLLNTGTITTSQIFDSTFDVFVDGAETRKERNTTYTMYTIRCRALATDDTDPDGAQMLIEEPVEVIVMRRYSDFRKMLGKYSKRTLFRKM